MAIGDLILLALAAASATAVALALRRDRRPVWAYSEWVAEHLTNGDRTVVVVARKVSTLDRARTETAERRELGAIANDDPDYERKLLDLLEKAANRAILLNTTPNG